MKHIMGQVNFDAPVIYCMNIVSKKNNQNSPTAIFCKILNTSLSTNYTKKKNQKGMWQIKIILSLYIEISFVKHSYQSYFLTSSFFAAEACI